MAKAKLVDKDIVEGAKLIDALDEQNFPLAAALWFYDSRLEDWRLVLATAIINRGPRSAYTYLQAALNSIPSLHIKLDDITIVSPNDNLIQALRSARRTGYDLVDQMFYGTKIGDVYIDGAYIYKIA